jgi:multidrug efflux pump
MIAVVILALLMVPVFFVAVTKFFTKSERDGEVIADKGSKWERLLGMFRRKRSAQTPAS